MKKHFLIISVLLFFINPIFAETMSLSYSFNLSKLIFTKQSVSTTAYDYIYTDDSAFDAIVGYPSIPYRIIKVIIPRGKDVQSVTVNNISWQPVTGNYTLYPIQQSITSGAKATFDFPDSEIYNSSIPYPSESVIKGATAYLNGSYNICYLRINLLQFTPSQNTIETLNNVDFSINLTDSYDVIPLKIRAKQEQDDLDSMVKKEVLNPNDVDSYKINPDYLVDKEKNFAYLNAGGSLTMPLKDVPVNPPLSGALYEYIIITSAALEPYFQDLANWRFKQGYLGAIFTTEYIYANYSGAQDYHDSSNSSEKIRAFMKDIYRNCGTSYVLLGGDVDIIPTKYTKGGYPIQDASAATDSYYSTGLQDFEQYAGNPGNPIDIDWISQGIVFDTLLEVNVECYQPPFGTGNTLVNESFISNLAVGRAPVDTAAEVTAFVNKTIDYEKNVSGNTAYLKNITASSLNDDHVFWNEVYVMGTIRNIDNSVTAGNWNLDVPTAQAPFVNLFRLYDNNPGNEFHLRKVGELYDPALYPNYTANGQCTDVNLKNNYNNYGCNIAIHWQHGIADSWLIDGELTASEAYSLDSGRKFGGMVLNWSCETQMFDAGAGYATTSNPTYNQDCVNEEIVKSVSGGFISIMGSSRVVAEQYCITSSHKNVLHQLYDLTSENNYDNYTVGNLFKNFKLHMADWYFTNHPNTMEEMTTASATRTGFAEMNLLGDPLAPVYSDTAQSFSGVSHVFEIDAEVEYDLTIQTGVPDAKVCLYKDEEAQPVVLTDATGIAVIPGVIAETGGDLHVTVTKHNYIPYEGIITVKDREKMALDWLRSQQKSEGYWVFTGYGGEIPTTALTGMAVLALLNSGADLDDPNVSSGLSSLLSAVSPSGAITYVWDAVGVYETSGALFGLIAARTKYFIENPMAINSPYDNAIKNAYNYLLNMQCIGLTRDLVDYQESTNLLYGGWGYPRGIPENSNLIEGWADMSNTQFAVLALRACDDSTNIAKGGRPIGLAATRLDWLTNQPASVSGVETFVSRCWNVSGNTYIPAGLPTPVYYDGGYNYKPAGTVDSGSHSQNRSYGSMTAAGIWSLWCANVPVGMDPRYWDAKEWLDSRFSVNINPVNPSPPDLDPPTQYLYYYYLTFAKAYTMLGWSQVGAGIDWYDAIRTKMYSEQNPAGYWVNIPHIQREDAVTATIFGLLALQTKQDVWGGVLDIELLSPANVFVVDEEGRTTGIGIKEIPGATFADEPHQRVRVSSPGGIYTVKLVGTGTGNYTLKIKGDLEGDQYFDREVTGYIMPGEEQEIKVIVNSIKGPFEVQIITPEPTPTSTTTPTTTQTLTYTMTETNTETVTPTITETITLTNTETTTPTETESITETSTKTVTETITQTSTVTSTPTITVTSTVTSTPTLPAHITLEYMTTDTRQFTNTIRPQFRIYNIDSGNLNISSFEVRYWYSFEGTNQSEQAWIDYVGNLITGVNITGNTTGTIVTGDFSEGQDRYLSVTFDSGSGTLSPNDFVEIKTRFNKADWSDYDQNNDWSYDSIKINYLSHEYVGVYYDGVLIWGMEPAPLPPTATYTITDTITNTPVVSGTPTFTITLTSTETSTNTMTETSSQYSTITPTPTITPTETMTSTITLTFTYSPTPTPGAEGDITLKFMTTDMNATTNSPHPWFQLYNDDSASLDLNTVEVRYWYSYETGWGGSTPLEQSVIDYTGKFPSGNNITSSTIHSIVSGSFGDNQNRYLKITFNTGAGSLAQGEYVQVQSRFNKTDWSNYDQGNEWSFVGYSTFTDWDKVTVYINGTLVWGSEPGGMGIMSLKGGVEVLNYEPLSEETTYNYPNPCKDETIIRFSLAKLQDVSIRIVDMKGSLVWSRDISSGETRRGINHLTWNTINDEGKSVANGVYLLRIIAEDASVTKKISVIK